MKMSIISCLSFENTVDKQPHSLRTRVVNEALFYLFYFFFVDVVLKVIQVLERKTNASSDSGCGRRNVSS